MVSSISNDSSQNAVAQVLQQQHERIDEQRAQQIAEQRRQVQIELVEETKATQRQGSADERRGRSIDISV
ncbi:MAG: hypothetical protein HRT51_16195 [Colwellia sp.]|nr:hypothetical protein [Colwellia sp.]